MKKNVLFLIMAVALTSVRCTHNYYYGTVYTSPGHQSSSTTYSGGSTGSQGNGGYNGSSGSGTATGNNSGSGSGSSTDTPTHADPPGRPNGTTTGSSSGGGTTGGGTTPPTDTPGGNTGAGSGTTPNTTTLPQQISTRHLFRTWMHSHEEDEGQVQVFRPSTYAFPPARGRDGYTFEAGGKVIKHDIAATDGTEKNTGTWTLRNKTLQISSIRDQRPYQLEIVSLDDKVLKVKRR